MNFLGIMDLFNSPITIILLVIVVVALILTLTSFKPTPKLIKEDIEKILKEANIEYLITETENKSYSFDLDINNKQYVVLVLPIEKYAEITINNFNTWEMHFGAGDKPGKAQPFKTKITEIPAFMALETTKEKIVLIQPNAKQIVVWKNENEIVDVLPQNKVYGIHVLNVSSLPELFNDPK